MSGRGMTGLQGRQRGPWTQPLVEASGFPKAECDIYLTVNSVCNFVHQRSEYAKSQCACYTYICQGVDRSSSPKPVNVVRLKNHDVSTKCVFGVAQTQRPATSSSDLDFNRGFEKKLQTFGFGVD